MIYDCIIERRSEAVVETARQTDQLVSSLFPSHVKHQLMENAKKQAELKKQRKKEKKKEEDDKLGWKINLAMPSSEFSTSCDGMSTDDGRISTPKRRLKSFLDPNSVGMMDGAASSPLGTEPIVSLFRFFHGRTVKFPIPLAFTHTIDSSNLLFFCF